MTAVIAGTTARALTPLALVLLLFNPHFSEAGTCDGFTQWEIQFNAEQTQTEIDTGGNCRTPLKGVNFVKSVITDPIIKTHGNFESFPVDWFQPPTPVARVRYEAIDYDFTWNAQTLTWDKTETVTYDSDVNNESWEYDLYGNPTPFSNPLPFANGYSGFGVDFGKAAGVANEPTWLEIQTNTPPGQPLADPTLGYLLTNPTPSTWRITVSTIGCTDPAGTPDWVETTYEIPFSCASQDGFDRTKGKDLRKIGVNQHNEFTEIRDEYTTYHPNPVTAAPLQPVEFHIDAGPEHAFHTYWMVGTLSGSEPGFVFPNTGEFPFIHFPLNLVGFVSGIDPYFSHLFGTLDSPILDDHFGFLDGNGRALVKFQLPGETMSVLYNQRASHAYFILDFVGDIVGMSGVRPIDFVQ